MNTHHSSETRVERFGRWIIRWRWLVVAATLAIAAVAAYGAKNIVFTSSYRVFFSEDNPQLKAFDELQNRYTKDDNILFVLAPKSEHIYERDVMEAVAWLTEESWKLPYATRVDSITNFQHSVAEEDDLFVDDLVPVPSELQEEDLKRVREVVTNEPLLFNRLAKERAHTTGVNAILTFPEKHMDEVPEATVKARELAATFKEKYPDIEVYMTGMVMLNNAFAESSMVDMSTITPMMYLGIIVTMMVLLRSFSGTLSTLVIIIVTSLTALGIMGWIGIGMSPPVSTAPTMIMTLAVADSIHILVTFLREMRLGRNKQDALVESLRVNFQPIFLTSLTTTIGFLSMNFSDAPPFRDLGNVVAIGVVAAWLYAITLLPALIAILPVRVKVNAQSRKSYFDALTDRLVAHRYAFLGISTAIVIAMALLIPRLELNDQWVEYFAEDIKFRTDTDYAMENLSGIYTLEFSLPAKESGGIHEPEYLKTLDAFSAWYLEQPGVLHVTALSDVMKRLHKNMHGDDPDYYRIPESRELAAQYLLLYEMSLPYGLDLNNQINVDKSATRVIIIAENLSTAELREMIESGEAWLQANAPSYMAVKASSPSVMFAYISERNIVSMLIGTLMAVILISIVMGFALRSVRFGFLSLIPNLIPAVIGFGIWAMFIGEIGLSLSVVTGMTLGIVVDDTVHFLSKYLRARREKGLDAEGAVRYAFDAVGRAITVTTIILAVGFSILSFSTFRLNSWMGQLTAIVIVVALIADFILLPALLLVVDRKKNI